MDQILLGLGAAGATLLVIAVVVALWEHRRHIAEMRQQLAWSENTRDLLQAHAKDVDAKLATLSAALHAQLLVPPTAGAVTEVAKTATAATVPVAAAAPVAAPRFKSPAGTARVAMAAAQSAVKQQWIDTEPMVLTSQVLEGPAPDFDPTMPAELSAH